MIFNGDALTILKTMPSDSVDCCVTSPPYFGLRDYGVDGQIGLEHTVDEYVDKLSEVFAEVNRVLKDDGTLWLNLGDSYAKQGMSGLGDMGPSSSITGGNQRYYPKIKKSIPNGLKAKDLIGIPWRVAFRLQQDGWYLRQDIIWSKPNPMPESVTDRCTKSHEYIFLLSKSNKYHFDHVAIKEPAIYANKRKDQVKGEFAAKGEPLPGQLPFRAIRDTRNKRTVWTVTTKPFKGAHFATFPKDLITPCILAGCPSGGVVLDPFFGAGTTGLVAMELGRDFIGIELNPEYIKLAENRLSKFDTQSSSQQE
jgi:DNA modification methylase